MTDTERLDWVLKNAKITNYSSLQTSDKYPCNTYCREDIDKCISFDYWAKVEQAAKKVRSWPDWKKGI